MNDARINRQWTVAAHPTHDLDESHFQYREVAIDEPRDGELLLKSHYLNVAPVMRMYMMKDGAGRSPESALQIGDVIHGRGVAEVVTSRHPDFNKGDFVHGQIGWQTYKVTRATAQEKLIRMQPRGVPAHYGLSALGMTGYSAYIGFVIRGEPKTNDAVLISGAAGGVGSLVVQIAKAMGCSPIIGIAGTNEKCDAVIKLGADACINYKDADVGDAIEQLLPNGIDLFFDNVGGEILEAALERLAMHARVVMCGAISEYARKTPFAPRNYGKLRSFDADMRGFFVYNHTGNFAKAEIAMANWIRSGQLGALVDIKDGFEHMPEALMNLYAGRNIGKQIVRIQSGNDTIY